MQGFNMGRYYPPPESSSSPSFNKSHPLGQRARKLRSEGVLTVRFEMPFAIWCNGCPKPTLIGQGVRFNAEKKKMGHYFSTPIWQFRMKHAACGGWIDIRTDPKATEYVVFDGAKRRDYGDERRADDEGIVDPAERDRRREDAMAGLEGKRADEKVKKEAGQRVEELIDANDRWWKDPYEASRFVRKGFRRERKERVREKQKTEDLRDRMGLDVELVPENELDRQRAQLVEFGDWTADRASAAVSQPLFLPHTARDGKQALRTKSETAKREDKHDFKGKLQQNTRAAVDPFMVANIALSSPDLGLNAAIASIKKPSAPGGACPRLAPTSTQPRDANRLVAYDSE